MAEEKKSAGPAKPTTAGDNDRRAVEQVAFLVAGLFILGAIATASLNYVENLNSNASFWGRIADYFLETIWPVWKIAAAIASAFALLGIIYNSRKLKTINIEENKIFNPAPGSVASSDGEIPVQKNEKWEKIIGYANSNNASDWRLAIIEADVILEEFLRATGYVGESVGEMLKSVDKSDFLTLNEAWEAHKIRNQITHIGGDFQLNERETKRVVALFEKVFREFGVI